MGGLHQSLLDRIDHAETERPLLSNRSVAGLVDNVNAATPRSVARNCVRILLREEAKRKALWKMQ